MVQTLSAELLVCFPRYIFVTEMQMVENVHAIHVLIDDQDLLYYIKKGA